MKKWKIGIVIVFIACFTFFMFDICYERKKLQNEIKEVLGNNIGGVNPYNSKDYIKIHTPDGSGQGVHPDVLFFKNGFKGYKYWMAFTPYPFGDDNYENPCILVSNDGKKFVVPKGVTNPIVKPPMDVHSGGHYSDPDILFSEGKFILHYAYNRMFTGGPAIFYRTESSDGIHWSDPDVIFMGGDNSFTYSPVFSVEDKEIRMWYLKDNNIYITNSNDNEKTWSKPVKCGIYIGDIWRPWHMDIIKTKSHYEGLLCAGIKGYFGFKALFYFESRDGVNWKVSKYPVLFPSANNWDCGEIYRSSLIISDGSYEIWYSARDNRNRWHIGYTSCDKQYIDYIMDGRIR